MTIEYEYRLTHSSYRIFKNGNDWAIQQTVKSTHPQYLPDSRKVSPPNVIIHEAHVFPLWPISAPQMQAIIQNVPVNNLSSRDQYIVTAAMKFLKRPLII